MAKPRRQKLKVFRTPIGFHDAYVAAPTQKAALEAWGTQTNLFARGTAELVTDPELTKEPLERPGEVIKKLRATEAEQIRALANAPAEAKRRLADNDDEAAPAAKPKKRKPRPSRAAVDKAERALERAEERAREALAKLKAEEKALEQRRRQIEQTHREERERLQQQAGVAREVYQSAMAEWAQTAD
jgi:flagellar motility protein MotE (MotC chaperone)